jgi:rSAM/selenodomain-associated transferase 1
MDDVERVILFAKAPRSGGVKTRLAPPLTPEEASRLHEAMLRDQLAFVVSLIRPGRTAEICLDGPWACEPDGIPTAIKRTVQNVGDLGHRMEAAFTRGHAAGVKRIAIVGSDAPTLPASLVDDAFERLRSGAHAVVTPADDGGYVLIATSGRCPALFRDIPWGTADVMAVTRRRAADSGIALEETGPWHDVDVASDLPLLLDEVERHPGRAPATARVLDTLRLYLPQERVV